MDQSQDITRLGKRIYNSASSEIHGELRRIKDDIIREYHDRLDRLLHLNNTYYSDHIALLAVISQKPSPEAARLINTAIEHREIEKCNALLKTAASIE